MSTQDYLRRHFTRMGARLKTVDLGVNPHAWQNVRIDVSRDGAGEFFDVRYHSGFAPELLDVQPRLRHLVLMVRDRQHKNKFLLGHDERHWFAAALPDDSVRDVRTAIESLRPEEAQGGGVIRQGEWFFVPAPDFAAGVQAILRNDPLSRGARSKPHVCEEVIRRGGVTVMVCRRYPQGITLAEYARLTALDPTLLSQYWQRMVRDPEVYARGKVRHSDHQTIVLDGWHRVYMNRERFSRHALQVAFLD